MQERISQKTVFEEYFSEVPTFSFALNLRNFWFMKHETKQLRIVSFDWNEKEQITDRVRDQEFTLPEGLKIKCELNSDEAMREKLAKNLMEQLWTDSYASPEMIGRLANAKLSPIRNLYNN